MIPDGRSPVGDAAKIVYHHLQMRRGFSIVLMLVFGLMPLSALVPGSEDANLPACCRRHGAHHCAMNMAAARGKIKRESAPAFSSPLTCGNYPAAETAFSTPPPALTVPFASARDFVSRMRVTPGSHAAPIADRSGAHSGRGPPQA